MDDRQGIFGGGTESTGFLAARLPGASHRTVLPWQQFSISILSVGLDSAAGGAGLQRSSERKDPASAELQPFSQGIR
jgi:hypothetical protein